MMHGKHGQVAATILQTSVKCHGSTALCHDCKIMKNPNIFQTILSFLNSRTAEEGLSGFCLSGPINILWRDVRTEYFVKLFFRFRPLCLRYLQPAVRPA
jgi:hypothetical protein